jgi:adenylate cyclase
VSEGYTRTTGRRPGVKVAVTGLVLATVVLTALSIHFAWSNSARENVADVARQLDQQIVASIQHELRGVLDEAVAAQQAVGSMFSNGTIAPEDEARRDFFFLALLRAQPSLSWVSLGTPDGDFFGAVKVKDDVYDLVSVQWDAASGTARERRFKFQAIGSDMVFADSIVRPTAYKASDQGWYRRAVQEDGPGWNLAPSLPSAERAAISTSTSLVINTIFRGVINVVIELERLSSFLAGLQVGKNGTAVVIDRDGEIVAAADPRAVEQQRRGEMPTLRALAEGNPLLALIEYTLQEMHVTLPSLNEMHLIAIRSPVNGKSYYVTFGPLNFQGWVVATIIPAKDFLASIEQNAQVLLVVLVLLTCAMAGLAVLVAQTMLARPLARIAEQLKSLESFHLDRVERVGSWLRELDGLSQALLQMSRGLAAFEKYLPTELVRTLVSQGVEVRPGGQHETLTVLFSDLAGFTSLSEKLGGDVVPVLTELSLPKTLSETDSRRKPNRVTLSPHGRVGGELPGGAALTVQIAFRASGRDPRASPPAERA